jgi:hypothetical protein
MRGAGLALLAVVAPAAAQSPLYTAGLGSGGFEVRHVSFGTGVRLEEATQVALRVAGGVPVSRRLFVDAGTNYGVTHLRSVDGIAVDLRGLTDTQLRAVYTIGRDLGAISLLVSLPTGTERVSRDALPLLRSIAQEFLPFPISTYGMGFGVTGGAAVAQRVGSWTFGAAGSVRYVGRYSPFSDVDDMYSPGAEAQLRLGARRPMGRTTVQAGLTLSTFGTDEFAGQQQFRYRAGPRIVAEAQLAREFGRTVGRLTGWLYYRAQGDSSGIPVPRARERIVHGSSVWSVPLLAGLTLDPGLETRIWRSQDSASGWLVALRLGARWWVSPRIALAPTLRGESGDIQLAEGIRAGFQGITGGVIIRVGG